MIYHLVAMAQNRVIGKNNQLPWHFSADLKHFKALTTGNTVIMGRKTFESIGRPLPNRENIVITRSPDRWKDRAGIKVAESIEEAFSLATQPKIFIIGGAELYRQTLDSVDGIWLTLIHHDYQGDAFYPEIPPGFRQCSSAILQEEPKIEVLYYENTKTHAGRGDRL